MRTLLLVLFFMWQGLTAPRRPDPEDEVKAAREWLNENVSRAKHFTPALASKVEAAGFRIYQIEDGGFRGLRENDLWKDKPVERLVKLTKTIPGRMGWYVTDVWAMVAIGKDDHVLVIYIDEGRVSL